MKDVPIEIRLDKVRRLFGRPIVDEMEDDLVTIMRENAEDPFALMEDEDA